MDRNSARNFVKGSILASSDGVLFNEETPINGQSISSTGKNNVIHDKRLNFRPIQEQIREEKEKMIPPLTKKTNEKLDEKLLTMIMPNDTINEDDFDYFQYFGSKRTETEASWVELQQEDIEKFKANRSNLVIKEEDKPAGVYIAKEDHPAPILKAKVPVKLIVKKDIKHEGNDIHSPVTAPGAHDQSNIKSPSGHVKDNSAHKGSTTATTTSTIITEKKGDNTSPKISTTPIKNKKEILETNDKLRESDKKKNESDGSSDDYDEVGILSMVHKKLKKA